jgi:Uma2 family endonuclease
MLQPMHVLAKPRMTVDEFLAWAQDHPGRYELFRGEVYARSAETTGHIAIKGAVFLALHAAIRARGVACHVLADGATVRIDSSTACEPDALVYCGEKLPPTSLEVPDPVIVVEVLSQSTRRVDVSLKLAGYFQRPSVMHYLVVDPSRPTVIHHARGSDGAIVTRIVTEGSITLDPPGIELRVSDIYSDQ